MKYVVSILAHLKFFLVPPFAALLIWFMTSFSASMVKYVVPRVEEMIFSLQDVAVLYYNANPESQLGAFAQMYNDFSSSMIVLIQYLGNWIYGLSQWFPLDMVVNTAATLLLLQIAYVIVRYIVKLATFGQV